MMHKSKIFHSVILTDMGQKEITSRNPMIKGNIENGCNLGVISKRLDYTEKSHDKGSITKRCNLCNLFELTRKRFLCVCFIYEIIRRIINILIGAIGRDYTIALFAIFPIRKAFLGVISPLKITPRLHPKPKNPILKAKNHV